MSQTELAALLPYRRPLPDARARLLCFAFAGGAAVTYRTWNEVFAPSVEVCAIELPGHGQRFREPPISDIHALIDRLAAALAPLLDRPIVCFGHSLGARVAYWLALREPRVIGLIASASPAAHLTVAKRRADLSRPALIAELHAMGGTSKEVLDTDDLMTMFLPAIRADFRLLEQGVAPASSKLACPITVLAARDDLEVSFERATAWSDRTDGEVRVVELQGGHFFLQSRRDAVIAEVRAAIDRWV